MMDEAPSLAVLSRNKVIEAIRQAATDVGRDPKSVELVCVSKTYGAEIIKPVIQAGQRLFGENRVQEAMLKWPHLRESYGDIKLHLIGPLQTNKVREAMQLFDVIETLDRPKLAAALANEIARSGKKIELFVQVNTGSEDQKSGVLPSVIDRFIEDCRKIYALEIAGLMCIPPVGQQASPHFALLAQIAKRHSILKLSMGMSADFGLAIQLGATHVRVGSAIFGNRPAPVSQC